MNRLRRTSYVIILPPPVYFLPSGLATLADAADDDQQDEGAGDSEDLGAVLLDGVAGGGLLDLGARGGDALVLGDLLGRGDGGVLDGRRGGLDGAAGGRDDLLGAAAVLVVGHVVSRGVVVEALDDVGGHG